MSASRTSRIPIWPILILFLVTLGCSRVAGVPKEGTSAADEAPFHDSDIHSAAAASKDSAEPETNGSDSGVPFHDSAALPAGTLLTVRLAKPIPANSKVNSAFEAVVDQDVVIAGNTVIARGTPAEVRLESARVTQIKPIRGYLRLTLESVRVRGVDASVRTASLFERQHVSSAPTSNPAGLQKGQRLTFRLSEPLSLSTQRAQADH